MEAGRIMSRMTGDVNALNEFLTSVVAIVSDIFVLIGIVAIMFTMNWELASIVLLVLPIIAVATHLYRKRSRQMYREVRTQNAVVTGHLAENISGVRVVQAFAREDTNLQNFDVVNRENLRLAEGDGLLLRLRAGDHLHQHRRHGGGDLVRGQRVLAGVMTVGSLYAFLAYVGRFFEPINDLSSKYNSMQAPWPRASGCSSCWTPRRRCRTARGAGLPPIEGDVVFEDVVFEYVPDRPVLRDLPTPVRGTWWPWSATPAPARAPSSTSCSASTTSRALHHHRRPRHPGRHHGEPRRQVGLVLQDPFLFSGSIRDNIRYGRLDATDEQVVGARRPSICTTSWSRSPSATTRRCRSGGAPSPRASASCSPSPGPSSPTPAS